MITVCVYFGKKVFSPKLFLYFFLIDVNFEYLTVGLHILITSSLLTK